MLKEVEAKLHAPDDHVRRLAEAVSNLPPPTRNHAPPPSYFPSLSAHNSVSGSRHPSVVGTQASDSALNTDNTETADRERQHLFYNLNLNIATMAPALEEKIAVLSTANQALQRHLDRMLSSYNHIPEEVSEEARLGNPKHWAYVTEKETKKAPERSRRDVQGANALAAAAAAMQDSEAASRSEARREAVAARKSRAQAVDSDFDDKPAPKKGPSKAKKTTEAPNAAGLVIQNGATAGPKKRRAMAGVQMERSLSGALAGQSRTAQASPRATPDIVPKKRAKPGPAPKKRYALLSPLVSIVLTYAQSRRPQLSPSHLLPSHRVLPSERATNPTWPRSRPPKLSSELDNVCAGGRERDKTTFCSIEQSYKWHGHVSI
jgi:hypothetical protein